MVDVLRFIYLTVPFRTATSIYTGHKNGDFYISGGVIVDRWIEMQEECLERAE